MKANYELHREEQRQASNKEVLDILWRAHHEARQMVPRETWRSLMFWIFAFIFGVSGIIEIMYVGTLFCGVGFIFLISVKALLVWITNRL